MGKKLIDDKKGRNNNKQKKNFSKDNYKKNNFKKYKII